MGVVIVFPFRTQFRENFQKWFNNLFFLFNPVFIFLINNIYIFESSIFLTAKFSRKIWKNMLKFWKILVNFSIIIIYVLTACIVNDTKITTLCYILGRLLTTHKIHLSIPGLSPTTRQSCVLTDGPLFFQASTEPFFPFAVWVVFYHAWPIVPFHSPD